MTRASPPIAIPAIPARATSAARWPSVIGIILMLYAALHILGGVCSLASPVWNSAMKADPSGQGRAIAAVAERWFGWSLALGIPGAALAVLALSMGIGFLNRRPWSVGCARVWCVMQSVIAVGNSIIGYLIQSEMLPAIAASQSKMGSGQAASMAAFMRVVAVFSTVFGLAWGLGLPVFLLVWLRRPAVRREYASWSASGVR